MQLNAGGSGILAQQIRRGAPADVLVSASSDEIERLTNEGLLRADSRRTIAANRLVLVLPTGTRAPTRLAEIVEPRFERIVIGNPKTAPVGRYARELLEALELWEPLASRLVLAENARQAVEYVARGEVTAGLVYATDAALVEGKLQAALPVPGGVGPAIVYEAAVVASSSRPRLAQAFVDSLGTDTARQVLGRHGFSPAGR